MGGGQRALVSGLGPMTKSSVADGTGPIHSHVRLSTPSPWSCLVPSQSPATPRVAARGCTHCHALSCGRRSVSIYLEAKGLSEPQVRIYHKVVTRPNTYDPRTTGYLQTAFIRHTPSKMWEPFQFLHYKKGIDARSSCDLLQIFIHNTTANIQVSAQRDSDRGNCNEIRNRFNNQDASQKVKYNAGSFKTRVLLGMWPMCGTLWWQGDEG